MADRIAILELLASQAAISLENARLYADLQRTQEYLAKALAGGAVRFIQVVANPTRDDSGGVAEFVGAVRT